MLSDLFVSWIKTAVLLQGWKAEESVVQIF